MTEFDKIIRYNYSPAERGQPVFLTDLGSGNPTPPTGGERQPEEPQRRSLVPLIIVLALLLTGMAAFQLYQSSKPVEISDPVRAGINCMDDAGGGTYCWRSE